MFAKFIDRFFATDADREESISAQATILSDEPVDADTSAEPSQRVRTIGDLLESLGLGVAHFRVKNDYFPMTTARNTTVVYRKRQDPRHTIEVATAVCSANDTFDKHVGLETALHRFLSNQTVFLPPMKADQTDYELLRGTFG